MNIYYGHYLVCDILGALHYIFPGPACWGDLILRIFQNQCYIHSAHHTNHHSTGRVIGVFNLLDIFVFMHSDN